VSETRIPGLSPHPALSPERIAAARAKYGHSADRYLESLHAGDPLADQLVERFHGMARGEGQRMLMQALHEGIHAVDAPPRELVALFEQLDHVPFWVDWDRMNLASAKIMQNALLPAMSFAVYALPHAYLATSNKPLAFSTELLDNTARRYAITTRFITEVFMPGSLRRQADGFKFAVVTRVLHARVRRRLLDSGRWDVAQGLPLNQAHMAMGTIVFSLVVMDGMRRLGGRISKRELESVLLTWRYIGYLFGIRSELLYTSETEARHLMEVAYSLEFDPDDDSRRLCKALMDAAPDFLKIKSDFAARAFVRILHALSRKLLGDGLADRLGLPKERRRALCSAGIALVWILERFPVLRPPWLRRYMGVSFWIEQGDYEHAFLS